MKIQFEIVSLEVEKLYLQTVDEKHWESQCQLIVNFMEACGWSEDDYWDEWMRRNEGLDNPGGAPYITPAKVLS